MEFLAPHAEQRYAAVIRAARGLIVGLDFDGTLSPIVDDPDAAHIHPDAPTTLVELAPLVRGIAVVTGRPARQVVALGGLDEVGQAMEAEGRELTVFGQYGNERWSSVDGRVVSPRPPSGLSAFLRELPGLLRRHDAGEAHIEEKGLAVAVHTRRLPDPEDAFERLLEPLRELAKAHDLVLEPGRSVIEVRGGAINKGDVVRRLTEERSAEAFVFVGDDLGDLEAFEALLALREQGLPTLLVCSASDSRPALQPLADLADIVVPGAAGVVDFLDDLAHRITTDAR